MRHHPILFIFSSLVFANLATHAHSETAHAYDTTKATIIGDLDCLCTYGAIATPEYLFGTIVTNEMFDASAGRERTERARRPYVERYRCFVDLDQDGHDDVILSNPISQQGTGGLSFGVYLWTNGNYIAIGEIGTHPGFLYVEHVNECTRTIWTYWHSSGETGSIGAMRITGRHKTATRYIDVDLGSEGASPSTIGMELYDLIRAKATVPIRLETSFTTNGLIRWQNLDMRHACQ